MQLVMVKGGEYLVQENDGTPVYKIGKGRDVKNPKRYGWQTIYPVAWVVIPPDGKVREACRDDKVKKHKNLRAAIKSLGMQFTNSPGPLRILESL